MCVTRHHILSGHSRHHDDIAGSHDERRSVAREASSPGCRSPESRSPVDRGRRDQGEDSSRASTPTAMATRPCAPSPGLPSSGSDMRRNSGWRQGGTQSGLGVARGLIPVPVEFLSDEHVAAYGRFEGVLVRTTRAENPDSPVLRGIHGHYSHPAPSVASGAHLKPGNRKGTNPGPPDRTGRTNRTALVLITPPHVRSSTAANCGPPFGTKRPQVQILSPRPASSQVIPEGAGPCQGIGDLRFGLFSTAAHTSKWASGSRLGRSPTA